MHGWTDFDVLIPLATFLGASKEHEECDSLICLHFSRSCHRQDIGSSFEAPRQVYGAKDLCSQLFALCTSFPFPDVLLGGI